MNETGSNTVNRAFAPSEADLDAARRLVAAASGGAERHEGRMIEALHVAQALLEKPLMFNHHRGLWGY